MVDIDPCSHLLRFSKALASDVLRCTENTYHVLQACENGRGAVLLSVARGKVSEGIDFRKTCLWRVCGFSTV